MLPEKFTPTPEEMMPRSVETHRYTEEGLILSALHDEVRKRNLTTDDMHLWLDDLIDRRLFFG